jgi:hypothetical protein
MDMENQGNIRQLVDRYGPENVVVVLGSTDVEGVEMSAETLTVGDPSFSGPLGGVQLGLRVYHILEPEVKAMIPPDLYEEKLGMVEMISDVDRIQAALRKMRENFGSGQAELRES